MRSGFPGFLERFERGDAQVTPAVLGGEALWIEQRVECQAIHDGSNLHGEAAAFLDCGANQFREERIDLGHGAAETHLVVEPAQALQLSRMANDEHLKFEIEQDALPVVQKLLKMPRKNIDALLKIWRGRHFFDHTTLVARNIFFKDGEEDIFLVTKVVIEGAARLAGPGGDVFNPGRFETVAGEDFPSRAHQFLTRNQSPFLLMRQRFQALTLSLRKIFMNRYGVLARLLRNIQGCMFLVQFPACLYDAEVQNYAARHPQFE